MLSFACGLSLGLLYSRLYGISESRGNETRGAAPKSTRAKVKTEADAVVDVEPNETPIESKDAPPHRELSGVSQGMQYARL